MSKIHYVSSIFPNAVAVNEALRGLAAIARKVPALPNHGLHQTKRARRLSRLVVGRASRHALQVRAGVQPTRPGAM